MKRRHDEGGAAAVETALCICFIVMPIVFAIISYAYMLSFRQTLSQAAAEGARAAAVAPSNTADVDRTAYAKSAVNNAMQGYSAVNCNAGSQLTCTVTKTASCATTAVGTHACFKVTVSYPYRDHSLLPTIPGLGFTLPSTLSYSATAEVS